MASATGRPATIKASSSESPLAYSLCSSRVSAWESSLFIAFSVGLRLKRKLAALEREHEAAPAARLRPVERRAEKRALEGPPVVADLHHQQAAGGQVRPSVCQDGARVVEAVRAARKREARLLAVLLG